MRSKIQQTFDEAYKNACFQDDTPLFVWQDSWNSCVDYCATRLTERAHDLLSKPGYELAAHHLLKMAEELRDENNEQARPSRDDCQRPATTDIF